MESLNPSATLVEVGPRDGLQNEERVLSTKQKIELIERCEAAGLRRIEVTSFVHPARVPQLADAEEVFRGLHRNPSTSYSGLALNEKGVERALACEVDEVNFVVVATDTFSLRNQGIRTSDAIGTWQRIYELLNGAGVRSTVTIAAAFGCPFEGEVSERRFHAVAARILQSPPDEISLADTIGVATPRDVQLRVASIRRIDSAVRIRCHFHNTRNTGVANAITAIQLGVSALDASIGGFGGCPFAKDATGNVATEDLVYLLARSGIETGLNFDRLSEGAHWLGNLIGRPPDSQLSRVGWFPERA